MQPVSYPAVGCRAVLDSPNGDLSVKMAVDFDDEWHYLPGSGSLLDVFIKFIPVPSVVCGVPVCRDGGFDRLENVLVVDSLPCPFGTVAFIKGSEPY